jgi:hypothetical protein
MVKVLLFAWLRVERHSQRIVDQASLASAGRSDRHCDLKIFHLKGSRRCCARNTRLAHVLAQKLLRLCA